MGPGQIRAYSQEDFAACCELYTLNEPGRFPPGCLPNFEETLRKGSALFLIAEKDGKVRGCGGIRIEATTAGCVAWLSFGLIHPEFQAQGLGTTLLLARLSLLPRYVAIIGMAPVPASRGFYERFNFRERGRHTWPDGTESSIHLVRFSPDARSQCERLLANAGVVLTLGSSEVPIKS